MAKGMNFHASPAGLAQILGAAHNTAAAPGLSAWRKHHTPHGAHRGGTARPEHMAGQSFGMSSEDPGDRDSGDNLGGSN